MRSTQIPIEEVLGSITRVKILKELAKSEELTISLIISKTKSNHSAVAPHLKYLLDLGLITEKNFGRIKVYCYNNEDVRARSLKKFIDIWEAENV